MNSSILKRLQQLIRPYLKLLIIIVVIVSVILIVDIKSKKDEALLKRFALVQYNDSPLSELSMKGIIDGLSAEGMIRDKDYRLAVSNAQGDIATLNLMVDAVVNDRPDLVFITSTPPLQVAAKKIKDIPVVFTVVADPVIAGAGTSFENHQSNVTGISTLGDYEGMIKWVKLVLPSAKVLGTLFTPSEANSVKNMGELKKYAEMAGLKLITVPVNSSQEVTDASLALASQQPDVICQIVDNVTSSSSSQIIKIAKEQNIPVFGFVSDQAQKGAVLVVSRDYHQAGVDAVKLAMKILNGTDPAKIPFEFVSKTNIIINPAAAQNFKITFPDELLKLEGVIVIK